MASEDNFLRLDPMNYDNEVESLILQGFLSLDDIEALYYNDTISRSEYEEYKNLFSEA